MVVLTTLRMVRLVAFLLTLTVPVQLWAEDAPRHGLMWNKTGLPLVFPLVIQTDPGRDYYVLLHDTQMDKPALAAYVEGGRFFRVLAPPGNFRVEIRFGTDWKGEDRQFGPQTGTVTLDGPLTFEVKNFSTKGGHVIDLRGLHSQDASLGSRALRDCQGFRLAAAPDRLFRVRLLAEERAARQSEEARLRWEVRYRVC